MSEIKILLTVKSDKEVDMPGLLKDNILALLNDVRPDLVTEDLNVPIVYVDGEIVETSKGDLGYGFCPSCVQPMKEEERHNIMCTKCFRIQLEMEEPEA